MLADEEDTPEPESWWVQWGDVLVFAIASVSITFLLLNWMWSS